MTSSSSLYGTVTTQNSSSSNSTSLYGEAGTPIPDSSGNVVVRGDLWVLSGNVLTTAQTGNLFPANATTVNLGLAATDVNIGAGTGTTTINNDLEVTGTFIAPSADFGNIQIAVLDNQTISTTVGELRLQSTSNAIKLPSVTSIYTDNTGTFNLLNQPTTIFAFRNATTLELGEDTGTTGINNNLRIDGTTVTLAPATDIVYSEAGNRLNRPTVRSTTGNSSGFRVEAPNATTSALSSISAFNTNDSDNGKFINISARGAASDNLRIQTGAYTAGVLGPSGSVVSFVDNVTTYATVNPAGPTNPLDLATKAYVDAQELNTTYTIDASTTTGGANFNLVGSDSTTDTIKFASGTGVTVTRTDANTITTSIGQSVATTASPTFAGATLGAIKVGVTTDNTIDTTSGNLTIAPATGIITVSAPTTVQYAEGNDRTKRFTFQSSSGNSTGVRTLAPNTGTSASATIGSFSSSDTNNGSFINLRANNSGTNPLRILTGTYTAGVLGASSGAAFVDNVTTYATVNPLGPTNNLDLITKEYFENNTPDPSQLVNGIYTFTLNADGTVTTPSKISAPGPFTLQGGALDPTTVVIDDTSVIATFAQTMPGGDDAVLTATNGSLTWAHTAGPMVFGSEDGTWSLNANGTTSFPNYTFPYADGSADQVLKTDGAGNLAWYSPSDLNTTYTIDASSTTGGANLNLVGSDSTTDTIKFAEGTNVTITATDANTITISAPDTNTTYTQNVSATTGGANLNLVGSDSTTDTVKFANGTGVTVAETDANTMTVSIGQAVGTSDSVSFADVTLDSMVNLNTATLTTSTTAVDQVADSFVAATYRTCKYVIQITSGSAYQAVEALLVHDGSSAFINTYSDVRTGANLTSINAAVVGANIELQVTPVNAVTTYKISKTLITV